MAAQIDPLALKAIADLQRPDKPDLLEMIACVFLSESPKAIQGIHNGLAIHDMEQVYTAALELKSSSSYLGATVLSGCCREIEKAAREDNLAACAALGNELEALFDGCCIELQSHLTKSA